MACQSFTRIPKCFTLMQYIVKTSKFIAPYLVGHYFGGRVPPLLRIWLVDMLATIVYIKIFKAAFKAPFREQICIS